MRSLLVTGSKKQKRPCGRESRRLRQDMLRGSVLALCHILEVEVKAASAIAPVLVDFISVIPRLPADLAAGEGLLGLGRF